MMTTHIQEGQTLLNLLIKVRMISSMIINTCIVNNIELYSK